MADVAQSLRHVVASQTWDSGGGVELDVIELEGGLTLVIADDAVTVYSDADEFWAETEDGDESHRAITLLRATDEPLRL